MGEKLQKQNHLTLICFATNPFRNVTKVGTTRIISNREMECCS